MLILNCECSPAPQLRRFVSEKGEPVLGKVSGAEHRFVKTMNFLDERSLMVEQNYFQCRQCGNTRKYG